MTNALLRDAIDHHVWATLRLLDACRSLTDEQLASAVPGTYGSILETLRHTVGADCWYLLRLDGVHAAIDEESADVPTLHAEMARHGPAWTAVLDAGIDPHAIVVVERDDGSVARSTKGLRVAQVLHHGTDHRSQVCTALTNLGIEPPEIDVWAYGFTVGRFQDTSAAG